MKALIIVVGLAVAGCTDPGADSALGITDFQVEQSPTGLKIVGIDADRATVGEVTLTVGRFTLQEDGREVDGRRMVVTVAGDTITHESEGYYVLSLPMLPEAHEGINEFLAQPQVAGALITWGVGLNPNDRLGGAAGLPAPAQEEAEAPNFACTFSGCAQTGTHDCEMAEFVDTSQTGFCGWSYSDEARCCKKNAQGVGQFAFRRCGPAGQNLGCGLPGGSGCAVCWQANWRSSCSAWTASTSSELCEDGFNQMWWTRTTLGWSYVY